MKKNFDKVKSLALAYFIIYAVVIVVMIMCAHNNTHTVSEEIIANTSAFVEGDMVVVTKYGLKKAMAGDVCDTLGIVTVVGEDGRIILKYKK